MEMKSAWDANWRNRPTSSAGYQSVTFGERSCAGSRGRLGRRGWPVVPELDTPWQDTLSPFPARHGWRQRAANVHHELHQDIVFAVDYLICRLCGAGWVEQPHTEAQYQRCGLASAGLTALRSENPGLTWHTLGDHLSGSRSFWEAVGADVAGGYRQRPLCAHLRG